MLVKYKSSLLTLHLAHNLALKTMLVKYKYALASYVDHLL